MKMQLISHVESKHILAACTLVGDGGTKIENLVGDGLPIRDAGNGKTRITLAAKHLEVTEVDLEMRVLRQPTAFILADGRPDAVPVHLYVPPPPPPAPKLVVMDGNALTLNLGTAISSSLEVWAHVSGASLDETPAVKVSAFNSSGSASEPLVASPGTYQVLLLIPGKRIEITEVTVP